ncbi:MAG: WG repeat-containing protein [Paludibacteraceae bacterium]|nr:WG repeat-containing protein [Paludibacteraceae bacterium]
MNKKILLVIIIVLLPLAYHFLSTVLDPARDIKRLNEKIKEYEYVGNFHEGLAAVVKDEKIGFIDKSGDLVIPMKWNVDASKYDEIMFYNGRCYIPHTINSNVFPPTINTNAYIIDKNGNELYSGKSIVINKETRDFDVMYVDNDSGHSTYFVKKDTVIKMESYENDDVVTDRNWNYNDPDESKYVCFSLENLCDGNVVGKKALEEKYGYRVSPTLNCSIDSMGLITLYNIRTNKYGIVDEKGNVVVPFQYDNSICLCYGLLIETLSVSYDSDLGFIKLPVCYNVYKDGRLLYEHLPDFSYTFAPMGMVLFNKAENFEERWKGESGLDERKIPKVNNETKWLDMNGKEVSRFQFGKNYLRPVFDGHWHLWQLEDEGGQLVYPNHFFLYSRFQNKIVIEDRNTSRCFFLTDTGDTIPSQYADYLKAGIVKMTNLPNVELLCNYKKELSDMDNYRNCHFYIKAGTFDKKLKVVRFDGLELLPFDVDGVSCFSDGLLRLKSGDRYFFIDEKGNGLIEN